MFIPRSYSENGNITAEAANSLNEELLNQVSDNTADFNSDDVYGDDSQKNNEHSSPAEEKTPTTKKNENEYLKGLQEYVPGPVIAIHASLSAMLSSKADTTMYNYIVIAIYIGLAVYVLNKGYTAFRGKFPEANILLSLLYTLLCLILSIVWIGSIGDLFASHFLNLTEIAIPIKNSDCITVAGVLTMVLGFVKYNDKGIPKLGVLTPK